MNWTFNPYSTIRTMWYLSCMVPTSSGIHGKPGKSPKKSSMHGKIMEFEKLNNYGKVMEFYEIIWWNQFKPPVARKLAVKHTKLVCLTASFLATGGFKFNYYPPTKSEGYSFGVVRASVYPSAHTFCLSGTISQYLLVRFDSFLVQMVSTMDSRYPMSYCPCFGIGNYKAKPISAFLCDLHILSKLLYLTTSHYKPWLPSTCR